MMTACDATYPPSSIYDRYGCCFEADNFARKAFQPALLTRMPPIGRPHHGGAGDD